MSKTYIFGDSYTNDLFPNYYKTNTNYFTELGKSDLTGITVFELSLHKFLQCYNNEIEDNSITTKISYLQEKAEEYKDKKFNVVLLIGHVDVFSDYYYETFKKETSTNRIIAIDNLVDYKSSVHYAKFIDNYKKIIDIFKEIFPTCLLNVISICPYILENGNKTIEQKKPIIPKFHVSDYKNISFTEITREEKKTIINMDFKSIYNRLCIINNGLESVCNDYNIDFINIFKHMWNNKTKNYITELIYHKNGKFDNHSNPSVIRDLLRKNNSTLSTLYNIQRNNNKKNGGASNKKKTSKKKPNNKTTKSKKKSSKKKTSKKKH